LPKCLKALTLNGMPYFQVGATAEQLLQIGNMNGPPSFLGDGAKVKRPERGKKKMNGKGYWESERCGT